MYVNGVATASVNEQEYSDGWLRTFRKAELPVFSEQEKELLTDYLKCDKVEEIAIYLERFRNVTGDLAAFCIRELVRGNL